MTPTDWLAVGEGLIGFVLGLVVGAIWILAHIVSGGRGRHAKNEGGA